MTAPLTTEEMGTRGSASLPALQWTEHPLVDLDGRYRRLTDDEVAGMLAIGTDPEVIARYWQAREERIRNAKGWFKRDGEWCYEPDPLRFGFDLPHWRYIRELLKSHEEVYCFGGNDGGKTTLIGRLTGEILTRRILWENMGGGPPRVLCVAQNDTMSKNVQQRFVYEHLPVEVRRMNDAGTPKKRSAVSKVSYSRDGGFTNGSFVLPHPRGSSCLFRNVTQYERNELGLEGDAYHAAVLDESTPLKMLEAIQFRTAKVNGKIIYAFTPVAGYDAVCGHVFTGARIVKALPMQWDWTLNGGEGGVNPDIQFPELDLRESYVPDCPAGFMPFIMQPMDPRKAVVFMWSHWNPFPPRATFNRFLPKIADKCVGRGHRMTLCRLFGYTDSLSETLVPNFKADYYPRGHLMKHADMVEMLKTKPHNLRHGVDPATARSWFQVWKAVCPSGLDGRPMQYLLWESPSSKEGEWVTADGERGDGTRIFAHFGPDDYKRYIRETEAGLGHKFDPARGDQVLRSGDPRGFAAQTGDGQNQKYLELFLRDDRQRDPRLAPMLFRPSAVKATVRDDVQLDGKLMDLLACDWDKPLDATNHPHLLISDACQNTIRCLLNCPVGDGDSPFKDGLDAVRYLCDREIAYFDPTVPEIRGGRGW